MFVPFCRGSAWAWRGTATTLVWWSRPLEGDGKEDDHPLHDPSGSPSGRLSWCQAS